MHLYVLSTINNNNFWRIPLRDSHLIQIHPIAIIVDSSWYLIVFLLRQTHSVTIHAKLIPKSEYPNLCQLWYGNASLV